MRILGIDFGLSKIGLAVMETGLARPLIVLKHSPDLIDKIFAICQENQIEKIVVGLPEGKMVKQVKSFTRQLTRQISLPIVFQDETLTTKEAIAKMIVAGKKRKVRQEKKDAFAAAVILQKYLEETDV